MQVHSRFFKVVELIRIVYSWIGTDEMEILKYIMGSHIEVTMWVVKNQAFESPQGTRTITVP